MSPTLIIFGTIALAWYFQSRAKKMLNQDISEALENGDTEEVEYLENISLWDYIDENTERF